MSPAAQAVVTVAALFLLLDPVLVAWWWALEGLPWRVLVAWVVTWAAIAGGVAWALAGDGGRST